MQLVSVIIPYYKKLKYINQTINSVLNQSYVNLEVIIIHDDPGNKDIKKITRLKKKDDRIKLIINKRNIGAGLSRNKGIKKAKGYFIAFCDADDLWKKSKLKKQILFMKSRNLNFCYTSYNQIDDKGKKIKTVYAPDFLRYDNLLKDCKIGLSTVILKKKLLTNKFLFPKLKTKEDLCLWIKLSKKIKLIGHHEVLSSWRKLNNSLSSNSIQKLKDGYKLYKDNLNFNYVKTFYYLFLLSINFLKKNI